ncbi:MAG: hypothetical protein ACRDKZ_14735, partial [Actinomycetota bacterium]
HTTDCHIYSFYVRVADVQEADPELLCAVCRDRFDGGRIARLEDFCRRCWEIVAPLLIEESDDPLMPLSALRD